VGTIWQCLRSVYRLSLCALRFLQRYGAWRNHSIALTLVSKKNGEERVYRIGACAERFVHQILPNQGGLAQRAGAAERGSISRACSAIAITIC
jgi:hypothetical protein